MSRVTDIIADVRDNLSDPNGDRWSEAKLLRQLNNGLKHFVLHTNILKAKYYIELEDNIALYDMSDYALKFLRFQYLSEYIYPLTDEQLDSLDPDWEDEVGSVVTHVILSNLKQGSFKIYPKVTGAADIIEQNSPYGGLIDITVTEGLFSLPSITDISETAPKYIVTHCIKKPEEVTIDTTDAAMEIDSMYDEALVAYITGKAFKQDQDTNNRQLGEEWLADYNEFVEKSKQDESINHHTLHTRVIPYKGFPA